MTVAVGFALQPDFDFLERVAPVIEAAEILEVTPETLWFRDSQGRLVPNAFHDRFLSLRGNRRVIAHGVGLSAAGGHEADRQRLDSWLAAIERLHEAFEFSWYSDHLGVTAPLGVNVALPLPVPATDEVIASVRARLDALATVVPNVALENTAQYFAVGGVLDDARLLSRVLGADRWLLLDLHNLHANAVNLRFDPYEWLEGAPLRRVIEIHLSGGRESPPAWLPSGRTFRLDSHDDAVPEAVWELFRFVISRCPSLQAVVLERMEGTVEPGGERALLGEMERARRMLAGEW